jgi:hypothetical protein
VVLVDTKVATIYMRPAMSVPLEVGPGRTILLRGGHGEVQDPGAMPTLLCDPRLTIELAERYRSHLPVWLDVLEKQVRKPQAKVILPSGAHLEPPDYQAITPEVDANPPQVSASDVVAQMAEAEAVRRGEDVDQTMRDSAVTAGWTPE